MILLISSAMAAVFIAACGQSLRKKAVPYYAAATLMAAVMVFCGISGTRFPAFVSKWIWPVFSGGGIAGALFIAVMFAGAMPLGSKAQKLLIPLRGQLSIIASIFAVGHGIGFGWPYLKMLFTRFDSLSVQMKATIIVAAAALLVMLPLFVTSFISIRRRMDPKGWKKLQRMAYPFYALVYLHVMFFALPKARGGNDSALLNVMLYSFVFLSYTVLRLFKFAERKAVSAARGDAVSAARRAKAFARMSAVLACCALIAVGGAALGPRLSKEAAISSGPVTASFEQAPEKKLEATSAAASEEARQGEDKSGEAKTGDVESSEDKSGSAQSKDIKSGASQSEATQSDAPSQSTDPAAETASVYGSQKEASAESRTEDQQQREKKPEEPSAGTEVQDTSGLTVTEGGSGFAPDAAAAETAPAPSVIGPEAAPAASTVDPEPAPAASTVDPEPASVPSTIYKDGIYQGTGQGYEGPVVLNVTIQNDRILSIDIVKSSETEPFWTDGKSVIPSILAAQSTAVDTVSGATYSSGAILDAVDAAMAKARN